MTSNGSQSSGIWPTKRWRAATEPNSSAGAWKSRCAKDITVLSGRTFSHPPCDVENVLGAMVTTFGRFTADALMNSAEAGHFNQNETNALVKYTFDLYLETIKDALASRPTSLGTLHRTNA